jgi:hypothetical protein
VLVKQAPELANLAAAALVFGQAIGGQPFFFGAGSRRHWRLDGHACGSRDRRRRTMMNALATFGGIALVLWIIVLLDWMARRKDRRTKQSAAR